VAQFPLHMYLLCNALAALGSVASAQSDQDLMANRLEDLAFSLPVDPTLATSDRNFDVGMTMEVAGCTAKIVETRYSKRSAPIDTWYATVELAQIALQLQQTQPPQHFVVGNMFSRSTPIGRFTIAPRATGNQITAFQRTTTRTGTARDGILIFWEPVDVSTLDYLVLHDATEARMRELTDGLQTYQQTYCLPLS
jgi:hypothetical protein